MFDILYMCRHYFVQWLLIGVLSSGCLLKCKSGPHEKIRKMMNSREASCLCPTHKTSYTSLLNLIQSSCPKSKIYVYMCVLQKTMEPIFFRMIYYLNCKVNLHRVSICCNECILWRFKRKSKIFTGFMFLCKIEFLISFFRFRGERCCGLVIN